MVPYGDVVFPGEPDDPDVLPYTIINMVASVNGMTALNGGTAGIGGPSDRRVMRTLRSKVDAVLIGAGTLRAERLDLGLDNREAPQPLAVVVSGSAGVSTDNLTRNETQRVLILIPQAGKNHPPATELPSAETVTVSADGTGRVDLRSALLLLRRDYVVGNLLVEGGPRLNAALITGGLVDELFLTVAPKLLPTTGPGILEGTGVQNDLTLISTNTSPEGEVFLRYSIHKP